MANSRLALLVERLGWCGSGLVSRAGFGGKNSGGVVTGRTGVMISGTFSVSGVSGEVCNSFVRRLKETMCSKVCRPKRPLSGTSKFHGSIVSLMGRLSIPVMHCPNKGFMSGFC